MVFLYLEDGKLVANSMKKATPIQAMNLPAMTAGLTHAGFRATIAEALASAFISGHDLPRISALYCAITAGLIRQEGSHG